MTTLTGNDMKSTAASILMFAFYVAAHSTQAVAAAAPLVATYAPLVHMAIVDAISLGKYSDSILGE